MKFFEDRKNALIILVVAILVFCISATVILFSGYKDISAKLNENEASLVVAQDEIQGYASQAEESNKKQQELQSQLDQANAEKKRLEDENTNLKQQITELAAKKKQEYQAATSKTSSQIISTVSGLKTCYLTFDDGPSANTLRILDTLGRYGVKATFFVIGSSSKIEYIKNIYDAGHAIGLHSATHVYKQIYTSTEAYLTDLQSISDTVEQLTGVKSMIIRFPGGGSNKVSKSYCSGIMSELTAKLPGMGYAYFDWNVSSGDADTALAPANKIVYNVLNGAKNKKDICVLMHDSAAKTTTADALPEILDGLISMGFSFDSLNTESYGFHHSVNN